MKNKKIFAMFTFLLFALVFVAPNVNAGRKHYHSWKLLSTSYQKTGISSHYVVRKYKCKTCGKRETKKSKHPCGDGYWVYSDNVKISKRTINKKKARYTITCKKCHNKWSEVDSIHLWP